MTNTDSDVIQILQSTRRIAMVGASGRSDRHSYRVMYYMQQNGYRVMPVNPAYAGDDILGEPVFATLNDVPAPIDMVNVFRKPEAIEETVDSILNVAGAKHIRFVWLQLGLRDDSVATRVRSAGLRIVMDRCLKIEFGRLLSHG